MKRPTPPCGKVCELRTAECKLTCCKWKMYEAEQAEYRREREADIAREAEIVLYGKSRTSKEIRKAHRSR